MLDQQTQSITEAASLHALSSLTRSLTQTTAIRDHASVAPTQWGASADLLSVGRYYHPSMRENLSIPDVD